MANLKLGEILRRLRLENGYTQQDVADMLGMKNKSTLGSWEIGKSEPDGFTLLRLCLIYRVTDIYKTFLDAVAPEDIYALSDIEQQIILAYRHSDRITKELVYRALGIGTSHMGHEPQTSPAELPIEEPAAPAQHAAPDIETAVADFRRQLELEASQAAGSEASPTSADRRDA